MDELDLVWESQAARREGLRSGAELDARPQACEADANKAGGEGRLALELAIAPCSFIEFEKSDNMLADEAQAEEQLARAREERRSGRKPAIKNIAEAVLTKNLKSTASWIVAGEAVASKLNVLGGRSAAAADAFHLAASLGWMDGMRLLGPLVGVAGAIKRKPFQVVVSERSGREIKVPRGISPEILILNKWRATPAQDGAKPNETLGYTALGFACLNERPDVAKFLVGMFRRAYELSSSLSINAICAYPRQVTPWLVEDCENNAILYALVRMDVGAAKTLIMAGAGSVGSVDEFAWALRRGRTDVVRMLLEANPQSRVITTSVGPQLLALAIDKADAALARMLLDEGVDGSKTAIHGMSAAAALALSGEECLALVDGARETMRARDIRALLAFAEAAPRAAAGQAAASPLGQSSPVVEEPRGRIEDEPEAASAGDLVRAEGRPAKVAEAIRELESFEQIVLQMGSRLRTIIQSLESEGEGTELELPRKAIGSEVRRMRERAAGAVQAIAKAGASCRGEP